MIKNITILLFLAFCPTEMLMAADEGSVISLNGKWELSYGLYDEHVPVTPGELKENGWPAIPATVPGNVELDLQAAGIIDEPEKGDNIYKLHKYEAYQWWYHRTFETPKIEKGERIELVFEGLDCFGSIWINNKLVGKTENMFIEHRFDVTGLLNPDGLNSVYVRIDPAVHKSRQHLVSVLATGDFRPEQLNIRKAPHMFGWDIMPRLVSAGLWRDVSLEIKRPTRIEQVYWMTRDIDVPAGKAQMLLDCQIATDYPTIDGLIMEVSLGRNGAEVYKNSYPLVSHWCRKQIELDHVAFWWPRGYGDAALYDATVRILDEKENVLDERKQRVGIRTAELVYTDITTEDEPGEFLFKINGEKIFVRGTNWVPLDAFHSRDKQHLKKAIEMTADLNCNMIRCWGGNVYEDNDFFDFCDENGIMVWQDFAMACLLYPQDKEFAETIRQEAISVVLKLRHHPSLVLWCGNNENDMSSEWITKKPVDPGMDVISREVLPKVIWEYDPIRSYLPSSPYYSEEFVKRGFDQALLPEVHLWGPRGYYKTPFYTETKAHFVSEIGYHGCPNRSSLERMFDPEYVYPWTKEGEWNEQWQAKAVRPHPQSSDQLHRNNLMIKQVNALFGGCPTDLDEFIFASQATQAEAMKYFVELWRMDKFRKTGIIWWNLRDGWPILSDAIVDYYNGKKLAYYYIKRVQHNACVMIGDAKNGQHPVIAVNDAREEKSGKVTVKDVDSGVTVFSEVFTIPANGKAHIGGIAETGKQAMWLIEYTIGKEIYKNHYLTGNPPFNLKDYQRWHQKLGIKNE